MGSTLYSMFIVISYDLYNMFIVCSNTADNHKLHFATEGLENGIQRFSKNKSYILTS